MYGRVLLQYACLSVEVCPLKSVNLGLSSTNDTKRMLPIFDTCKMLLSVVEVLEDLHRVSTALVGLSWF